MSKRTRMTVSLSPSQYAQLHTRKSLARRLLEVFGYFAVGMAIYGLVMLVATNLVTGCGQATYHADRTWETGTCHPAWLFPDSKQSVKGTW
jgi:hypothetical protein